MPPGLQLSCAVNVHLGICEQTLREGLVNMINSSLFNGQEKGMLCNQDFCLVFHQKSYTWKYLSIRYRSKNKKAEA